MSATAGIVGAMVGGGCAILATQLQSRAAHHQWRRQGRRDEYARFSTAAFALLFEYGKLTGACEQGAIRGADLPDWRERLIEHHEDVSSRIPLLALEGPAPVIDAALEVQTAVQAVLDGLDEIADQTRSDEVVHLPSSWVRKLEGLGVAVGTVLDTGGRALD
ncbi:hypothetical protein AB0N62_41665 [Streptomyces sp. NPDC093982]|uniref:hypothetical protein n=1 Tax=Streptomyces sp. NPDC093982 TaxID=3155077 RepID=UPI00341686BB